MNYYNEFDPYAAQWLRNLIEANLIPSGVVDERSIRDVSPEDLFGFTQCHFFAGIAGWSLALKLAGWPEDREVWTGSCPCQPFSVAGKRKGIKDDRHLWPEFQRLISVCRPAVVFGEQVASKDGRTWLSGVRSDLETLGYACGGADLCAAGISAPHIRQRLYWVADTPDSYGRSGISESEERAWAEEFGRRGPSGGSADVGMADSSGGVTGNGVVQRSRELGLVANDSGNGERSYCSIRSQENKNSGMADHERERPERVQEQPAREELETTERSGVLVGPWSDFILTPCADGKARRTKPGIPPLAHGVPARVGKLRAYGNAIVPPLAAEFIKAYLEVREC